MSPLRVIKCINHAENHVPLDEQIKIVLLSNR